MKNIAVGLLLVSASLAVCYLVGCLVPVTWMPDDNMHPVARGVFTLLVLFCGVVLLYMLGWLVTDDYNGNPYSGMQPRPPIPDPPPAPPMSGKSEPLKNERMW